MRNRRRGSKRKRMKKEILQPSREHQEDLFNKKDDSRITSAEKEEELIRAVKEIFGEEIEIFPGHPLKK